MVAATSSGGAGAGGDLMERIFGRRIEFHPAREPYSAVSSARENGFYLETLNPSGANQKRPHEVAFSAENIGGAPGKRVDGGAEFYEHGLDQELGFRITFRRIGAGLANLGNTCFLNSVLQCLTYTEPFAAYLQSGKHKTSCRTAGFCALCALQNHVMSALQSTGKILSPLPLVKNLRCISRNFRNSRQEDAHEYMVNLLESMHKCCLPSGVHSNSPSAYEKSLVHRIFGGRLRSQVKCTQCQFCSNMYDPFLDLSLEIVKAETLRKALSSFTAVEKLDGGKKEYQCERCKQKVQALKQLTIDKPPNVLTIHLKRFDAYPGHKIDRKVEFEPFLDLKPFVSDPNDGNLKYILYGVLVHAGWSTHSGHYYCFVRTSSGMWHSLDDNQVRQVSEKTVLSQKAYMLFYVRDRGPVKNSIGAIKKQNAGANTYGSKNNHQPTTPLCGANALFHPMEITKVNSNPNAPSSQGPISQNGNLIPGQKLSNLQSNSNPDPAILKVTATKDPIQVPSTMEPSVVTTMTGNSSGKASEVLDERPQKKSGNVSINVECQKVITEGCNISNGVDGLAKHEPPQGAVSNGVNALAMPEYLGNASNGDATSAKPEFLGTAGNGVDASEKPEFKDITSNVREINQKNLLKASIVPKCDAPSDKQEPSEEKVSTDDAKCVNQSPLAPTASSTQMVENKIHHKLEIKSRKLVKRPAKIVCFARNTLFVRTLSMQKNKKIKKEKRRRLSSNEGDNVGTSDQQASTSTASNGHVAAVREEKSQKRKHPKSSKVKNGGDLAGVNVLKENLKSVSSELAHANSDQSKINEAVPRAANNIVIKEIEGSQRCESYSLLMQGLRETTYTVPSWDDIELPKVQRQDTEPSKRKSIGYVLDEWDEEYDRGRRKKVKQSRVDFGGPNPFQETADINAQKKMRKVKTGSIRSGNKKFRN